MSQLPIAPGSLSNPPSMVTNVANIQANFVENYAAIALNTEKVGITPEQAAEITANTEKETYPGLPTIDEVVGVTTTGKAEGKILKFDAVGELVVAAETLGELNVLTDWNATSGDALILNKPSIPTTGVDFDPVGTDNSDNNAVNTLYSGLVSNINYPADVLGAQDITNILNLSGVNTGDAEAAGGIGEYIGSSVAISSEGTALANNPNIYGDNIGIGNGALRGSTTVDATGHWNIGIGEDTGTNLTTGSNNVLLGRQAGYNVTTGQNNTFCGDFSSHSATTGSNNICLGYYSTLSSSTASNEISLGSLNTDRFRIPGIGLDWTEAPRPGIGTLIGSSGIAISSDGSALGSVVSLYNGSIGIGTDAGKNIVGGQYNVVIGKDALESNVSGGENIAIGKQASARIDGMQNTFLGSASGYGMTSGDYNIGIGYQSLYGNYSTGGSGSYNIGLGYQTGHYLTTGQDNLFMGSQAGYNLTTGSKNVHLGYHAGTSTDTSFTHLTTFDDTICLGHSSYASAANEMSLGNSEYITAAYTAAAFATRSDVRDKEQIEDTELGLSFINELRPVSYHWKQENRNEKVNQGFIAQEVQETLKGYEGDHAMHVVRGDAPDGEQNIIYTEFIAPAIKAIQELSAKVDSLQAELDTLKGL